MVLVDEVTVVTPLLVSLEVSLTMEEVEEAVGFDEAVSGFNKLSVSFRLNIEVESFSIFIFFEVLKHFYYKEK